MLTPKQYARLVERDGHCLHCGRQDDTLVPNHRANRGMGGTKHGDKPSNLVLICSEYNGLIESSYIEAAYARDKGWKLYKWNTPETHNVFDAATGQWWFLDNDWGRRPVRPL